MNRYHLISPCAFFGAPNKNQNEYRGTCSMLDGDSFSHYPSGVSLQVCSMFLWGKETIRIALQFTQNLLMDSMILKSRQRKTQNKTKTNFEMCSERYWSQRSFLSNLKQHAVVEKNCLEFFGAVKEGS